MSNTLVKVWMAGVLGHKIEYQMTNPPRPDGVHLRQNVANADYSKGVPINDWEPSFGERMELVVRMEKIGEYLDQ